MRSGLTDQSQLALLRRVVEKRRPDLLERLVDVVRRPLSSTEQETFRELVAEEFAEMGLRVNDEPTGYGLALESLIDRLGDER
jgi:hypothetical protein